VYKDRHGADARHARGKSGEHQLWEPRNSKAILVWLEICFRDAMVRMRACDRPPRPGGWRLRDAGGRRDRRRLNLTFRWPAPNARALWSTDMANQPWSILKYLGMEMGAYR